MSVSSLITLVLVLALPFYSAGASLSNKEFLKRAGDVFKTMDNICSEQPGLDILIYTARRAYAKEYFGDARESREVDIGGVELLKTYQDMTVQTFVPKAHKQLSIFHAVFQDILQHWPQERQRKRKIIDNVKTITSKIGKLKATVRIPLGWLHASESVDVLSSNISQWSHVWTGSAYKQHKWILGVLGEFETSMTYLLPAFRKFSRNQNAQ